MSDSVDTRRHNSPLQLLSRCNETLHLVSITWMARRTDSRAIAPRKIHPRLEWDEPEPDDR